MDAPGYEELVKDFIVQVISHADLVIYLTVTAITCLVFILGHQCISNSRKDNALVSKLNIIERKLMTSEKECAVVKNDLVETREKLVKIQDNSFGSNEMVIDLKEQLRIAENIELELRHQVTALEKELETAAEAGLELNKMVSELLNNQSGSDSIINTVEELQQQLNEQETTTHLINNTLAEKSRENSELQIELTNLEQKVAELLKLIDDLKEEKESNETELKESLKSLQTRLGSDLEAKEAHLDKLLKENSELKALFEEAQSKFELSEARIEVIEESLEMLHSVEGNGPVNVPNLKASAEIKAELLALKKSKEVLKDKLEGEQDARNLLEDHLKVITSEITKLRHDYNQAEKDKLEAQTRLEVLSGQLRK